MKQERYERQLSITPPRTDDLSDRAPAEPEETLEGLRATLDGLRTTHEELRAQHQQLVVAHLQAETARRKYQELFELAPDAYLTTNLNGIIEEANHSASRLFGISTPLTGKALAAYIASDDRPHFRALLNKAQDTEGVTTVPFRLLTRDGVRLYAELTYSVRRNEHGGPLGFRWLIRNVTEQERLARQIRTLNAELEARVAERTADLQAVQQLSEDLLLREQAARRAAEASEAQSRHVQKLESIGVLAGGIAHDFNNLLHVVLGNADIALSRLPKRSPAREALEEVVRATIRAADLTRQMLAYSGKGAFVVRHLDLSSEVREMATLLRTAISKQASLVWELASNLPPVNADATQIRQIVMNLITNASDALGDEGGSITLRTGVIRRDELHDPRFGVPVQADETEAAGEDPFVFLEVSDTGAGMMPDTLQRIFDPFFSTKFAGRGLGLAAVMGIVRSHKGLIRIHTEPGQGTRFRVLFPAVEGTVPAPENLAPIRSDWRGSGTVLVVDDEEGVREVAERMLQDFGFTTIAAVDGRDALEIIERVGEMVTAVLLDISMPRMGGQETFRRLRQRCPDLPVIMMSGYTEQTVASQFIGSGPGFIAFLQKPFLAEDLVEILRQVVRVTPA
ncbi:MAG TPA: response regulator [Gemmatimonadales bacterium]|nr:response regulator [Gemmatimonadales bacterium]